MNQFCSAMEASHLGREKGCESVMRAVPVGEVAGGAGEAAEELLELAESGVAAGSPPGPPRGNCAWSL